MCRLDGPDLQDIRLQNSHQYHFKPQESAGHAFLFLWKGPKKSAQMCKLSQCLVFETERLVLQISVNISRPFDVSCKPEVTHRQAPTPPGLPPSNNQNFYFQITLCSPPPCPAFFPPRKRASYRAAAAWAPAWHPSCLSSAGARSRRWSASAPAAPQRGSTPSLRLPSTAGEVDHRLILSPILTLPDSNQPSPSPAQPAKPRSHRAAPTRPPPITPAPSNGSLRDYGFEAIQAASAERWQINEVLPANRIK